MKISEVKQEYQLQEWRGMLRERKESGLSVKAWCQEQGLAEHIYYYRLRKLRQAACTALEQGNRCSWQRFLWLQRRKKAMQNSV